LLQIPIRVVGGKLQGSLSASGKGKMEKKGKKKKNKDSLRSGPIDPPRRPSIET